MNLWTSRLVVLTPQGDPDRVGADVKSFDRGDSIRCAIAHDNDYWKATVAGPVEADAPILVASVIPSTEWCEFPANSGEVYRIVSRRVAQHGCLKVVHLSLSRLIGVSVHG